MRGRLSQEQDLLDTSFRFMFRRGWENGPCSRCNRTTAHSYGPIPEVNRFHGNSEINLPSSYSHCFVRSEDEDSGWSH